MTTFEWPFADGFDPDALDSEPGPQPWMKDWPALIAASDGQRRAYLAELEAHGLKPQFGYTPSSVGQIGLSPAEQHETAAGFLDQSIIFDHDGRTYRLTAAEVPPADPCPIDSPVGFASLTPYTEVLQTEPTVLLVPPPGWPVVSAIGAHKQWTDQMTVTDPLAVRQWAREHDQRFVLLWVPGRGHGTLELFEIRRKYTHPPVPAHLSLARRPCPMIEGSVCGQLCRMYGGPWVSRAIIAFGRWRDEQYNRLADVGCDTCGNGAIRIPPGSFERLTIAEGLHWPVTGRSDRGVTTSRYGTAVTLRLR